MSRGKSPLGSPGSSSPGGALQDLEARLERDARRLHAEASPAPDVLAGLALPPRGPRRQPRLVTLARAVVCGALATLLLAGADDRAGLRGAGRFVPAAQPRFEAPVAPAEAAKELAAVLSGSGGAPLAEEWTALARDAEALLEELSKRVAPLANVAQAPE